MKRTAQAESVNRRALLQWKNGGAAVCLESPLMDFNWVEAMTGVVVKWPDACSALPCMDEMASIDDAPKDGSRVLVAWPDGDMAVCYWSPENEKWVNGMAGRFVIAPSFYLPLPPLEKNDDD